MKIFEEALNGFWHEKGLYFSLSLSDCVKSHWVNEMVIETKRKDACFAPKTSLGGIQVIGLNYARNGKRRVTLQTISLNTKRKSKYLWHFHLFPYN